MRGGFAVSLWLNSSSLASPVDGRRPGALLPADSSTRIERDRVRRFAKRCLFFFGAADSKSVPVFFISVGCELLVVVDTPSSKTWLVMITPSGQGISLVFSVPFAPGKCAWKIRC